MGDACRGRKSVKWMHGGKVSVPCWARHLTSSANRRRGPRAMRPISPACLCCPKVHPPRGLLYSRLAPIRIAHSVRRSLHLAPPWLLDDYLPRYHVISSVDAAKKRSLAYAHLRECNLCPRQCGVNRYEKTGVCLIGAETVKVNTIAPHFGEGLHGPLHGKSID